MKRHLKRLAAPKSWNIKRKKTVFVVRQHPSGHSLEFSLSLNVFMKEMLGLAKTTKEVKTILSNRNILVDCRRRTDHRFAVGFLDTISIKETNDAFRIVLDSKGRLASIPIPSKEADMKICKIVRKTMTKGKKLQINLNDGKNYFVDEKAKYNVGDSLVIDLKNNSIVDHLPFGKDVTIFLISGKNRGAVGKVVALEDEIIAVKTADGKEYKTRKENGFVVGKAQPAVTLMV